MNSLQIFALVVLPLVIALSGWIVAVVVAPSPRRASIASKRPGPRR